jgi:hypothetical protein
MSFELFHYMTYPTVITARFHVCPACQVLQELHSLMQQGQDTAGRLVAGLKANSQRVALQFNNRGVPLNETMQVWPCC